MADSRTAQDLFNEQHPDPDRIGFLMMKFSSDNPYKRIENAVKDAFRQQGAELMTADDRHYDPDLLTNIKTYMHGCGFGVAVFDRILNDEFNPNVSLELGFMMALGKPVLILKDQTLEILPSDLVSRLYTNFDPHNPEKGLVDNISKWMKSSKINPRRFILVVHVQILIDSWNREEFSPLIDGIPRLVPNAGEPKFCGTRKEDDVLLFEFSASREFVEGMEERHRSGKLRDLAGIKIVDITATESEPRRVDYLVWGSRDDEATYSICRLHVFDGCESEAQEAQSVFKRGYTDKRSECTIYITRTAGGVYYFHSNFINQGFMYPTKILAIGCKSLAKIFPLILGYDNLGVASDKNLLMHHVNDVHYFFNSRDVIGGELPLDTLGAQNIRVVDT